MRSILALVLVLLIGNSAFAGPFGIFGQRRAQGAQGGCANGNCGAATQAAYSGYQYQYNFAQPIPAQRVVATPPVIVQPRATTTMPEGVLITTDPPARPNKITFNGVEYFPRH